jgi:hypothetical protein
LSDSSEGREGRDGRSYFGLFLLGALGLSLVGLVSVVAFVVYEAIFSDRGNNSGLWQFFIIFLLTLLIVNVVKELLNQVLAPTLSKTVR